MVNKEGDIVINLAKAEQLHFLHLKKKNCIHSTDSKRNIFAARRARPTVSAVFSVSVNC